MTDMDLAKLKDPFPAEDVSWRIAQAGKSSNGKPWAKVLAYLTNRAIMDRLDEVCGPDKWKNEFAVGPAGGIICGISILLTPATVAAPEWVTKWDGAENSDIEAVKGGLSDSMKRAAVQWGIGRYLYGLTEGWAVIAADDDKNAHYANCKIKVKGQEEWITFRWHPPELPDWALPKRTAQASATDRSEPVAERTARTSQPADGPPRDHVADKITWINKQTSPDQLRGVYDQERANANRTPAQLRAIIGAIWDRWKLMFAEDKGLLEELVVIVGASKANQKMKDEYLNDLARLIPKAKAKETDDQSYDSFCPEDEEVTAEA
jgi:hypothetical protein